MKKMIRPAPTNDGLGPRPRLGTRHPPRLRPTFVSRLGTRPPPPLVVVAFAWRLADVCSSASSPSCLSRVRDLDLTRERLRLLGGGGAVVVFVFVVAISSAFEFEFRADDVGAREGDRLDRDCDRAME